MKIGIIQGTTQVDKNEILYRITNKVVSSKNYEIINFGVYPWEINSYSYTEIAVLTALLINSKVVDFVITGCSSGQGMNLACNTLPGLLSGFIQNPQDAYLFGRINDGNVARIGFPPEIAERKIKETSRVKKFNEISKVSLIEFMEQLEQEFMAKILSKKDVIDYILNHSREEKLIKYISSKI